MGRIHGQSLFRMSKQRLKQQMLWRSARDRARRFQLPFNIEREDVETPVFCPVFGFALVYDNLREGRDLSPSLDRIVPELGYVKGNIRTVSWRANKLRSNATLSELEALTFYLKQQESNQ
jgi:hypothetical protein